MSNIVYVATSLDGYIAGPNGELDWLNEIPNPNKSDFGFKEFMDSIDAIVMGRKTYEKVLAFDGEWPYSKKVFVLSNSLTEVDLSLKDKAEIIKYSPREITIALRERGYYNLYIDGGTTIQGFLADDLIDELIITRIPIILGGGIPLFGKLNERLNFKHFSTQVLEDFLVKSHYKREN
jgi:dihydrofolate reductase